MKVAVVGTGFAGFGAVSALLKYPETEVHVFDIGLKDKLANQKDLNVPNAKTYKGSFFTYGVNDDRWCVKFKSDRICSSHALGGHSTVYSGAILYPKGEDLAEWPEQSRPQASDYKSVLECMDILHESDDLDAEFPICPVESNLSGEMEPVLSSACLGLSRVALAKAETDHNKNRSIFKTADFFENLARKNKIIYKSGCYLLKVSKNAGKLGLQLEVAPGQLEWVEGFDAVFLGAGCVNTTGVVDRSVFGLGDRNYELKSAGGLIGAFCRLKVTLEDGHAKRRESNFPEFFLEINSAQTNHTWTHTQITAINEQIIAAIGSKIPIFRGAIAEFLRNLFYFSLTCVHSRYSIRIPVICRTISENDYMITIQEPLASEGLEDFRKAVHSGVRRHWGRLRLLPIPFGPQIADFFRGNKLGGWHFGGTLSMSEHPEIGRCKPNGEVFGLDGAFVIDSAAFPEIPGSTIALLISAHAHRVASGWMNTQ
jgi:hypothetical protein